MRCPKWLSKKFKNHLLEQAQRSDIWSKKFIRNFPWKPLIETLLLIKNISMQRVQQNIQTQEVFILTVGVGSDSQNKINVNISLRTKHFEERFDNLLQNIIGFWTHYGKTNNSIFVNEARLL